MFTYSDTIRSRMVRFAIPAVGAGVLAFYFSRKFVPKAIGDESLYLKSTEGENFEESIRDIRGESRNVMSWLPSNKKLEGLVFISHGLHEHGLRYYELAHKLTSNNIGVYAIDHLGHGKSGGDKGLIENYETLVDDFVELIVKTQVKHPKIPTFIIGHSMGTLIAILASHKISNVNAMILSATPLDLGPDGGSPFGIRLLYPITKTKLIKSVTKVLSQISPNGYSAPLILSGMTSDITRTERVKHDKRHNCNWAKNKTSYEFMKCVEATKQCIPTLKIPFLCIHGLEDQVGLPSGSQYIYNHTPLVDNTMKRLQYYPHLKHECIHERLPDREIVMNDMVKYIQEKIKNKK